MPDDFDGIVFDIGRGAYDHHQRDSRVRENGVPYAAFGLLWEAVGAEILGEELAEEFDEAFVQPLDHNDNTGEKNELATLIGNFNPTWDAQGGNDEAFFQAVSVAGLILENKFERYRGNERADRRVEEILEEHRQAVTSGKRDSEDAKILIYRSLYRVRSGCRRRRLHLSYSHPIVVDTVYNHRRRNIP